MITVKKARSSLLAVTVALVAGASLATSMSPAQAAATKAPAPAAVSQSAARDTGVTTHANTLSPQVQRLVKGSGVAAEGKALESFWTPARMKAAVSLDRQTIKGTAPAARATTPQGPAKVVRGAAPITTPRGVSGGTAAPSYDFPNLPYYHPTARTVGKVFFSRSYGGSTWYFVCSAAIVNTEGKSTVWTAGHCLFDYANGKTGARVWNNDFAFVPSYSNGSRPYGTWYARNFTAVNAWINNRDFNYDNGATFMNRNFGYRIADYLGSQGIMWNYSANYFSSAFGYPSDYPFNGQYLVRATGSTVAAGGSIYMYSGMTPGSSGGPWFRNYDGNYGSINGHNDYTYSSSPNYMYSPYYGNQVANLYNAVRYQSA